MSKLETSIQKVLKAVRQKEEAIPAEEVANLAEAITNQIVKWLFDANKQQAWLTMTNFLLKAPSSPNTFDSNPTTFNYEIEGRYHPQFPFLITNIQAVAGWPITTDDKKQLKRR